MTIVFHYFKRCALIALIFALSFTPAFAGPLHEAAGKGDNTQVKRLLSEDVDVNAKEKYGETVGRLREKR